MSDIEVVVVDARSELALTEKVWRALFDESRDGFFLSWSWLHTWMSTMPPHLKIRLAYGRSNEGYQFAMLLGMNRRKQDFFFRSAHLCSVGDLSLDDIVIENNGILIAPSFQFTPDVVDQVFQTVGVHVAVLPFLRPAFLPFIEKLSQKDRYRIRKEDCPSYFVDLQLIEQNGQSFLDSISANKRRQIKRSLALYEARGPISITQAHTVEEASRDYQVLSELHRIAWEKRGKAGAFANPHLDEFHRFMLENHFDPQLIRLHVIRAGKHVIGALYGYVCGGVYSFYQSGFSYEEDNRLKPGLVCHALLIESLKQEGLSEYDFLAGNASYKKSLSSNSYITSSIELTRNHWFSKLLHWASSKLRKDIPQ